MYCELSPLHLPQAQPHRLPHEGMLYIGRRDDNNIACNDPAVSGQHCYINCANLEVVDCSSNGTYLNDQRLPKGMPQKLRNGDILSLSKPLEASLALAQASPRVQFRVARQAAGSPGRGQEPTTSSLLPGASMPATISADPLQSGVEDTTSRKLGPEFWEEDGLAQDILLQEQQSKAKVTAELLLARRRLAEERSRTESQAKDLRKLKSGLDEEQRRCREVESTRAQWAEEASSLQPDRECLKALQVAHSSLQAAHDHTDVELMTQTQRVSTLEAGSERSLAELERLNDNVAQSTQRMQEFHERFDSVQALADQQEEALSQAKQALDVAQKDVESLQSELASERSKKEQFDDQLALLSADEEQSRQRENGASTLLKTTSGACDELEERVAKSREEARSVREAAREAVAKCEAQAVKNDALRSLSANFMENLRAYGESWCRGLSESFPNCAAEGRGPGPMLAEVARSPARSTVRELPSPARSTVRELPDHFDAVGGPAAGAMEEVATIASGPSPEPEPPTEEDPPRGEAGVEGAAHESPDGPEPQESDDEEETDEEEEGKRFAPSRARTSFCPSASTRPAARPDYLQVKSSPGRARSRLAQDVCAYSVPCWHSRA
mmetsp:Transcript_72304/g.234830  ORF Transcript_72304/g.234830 Transcript_72304/m.234830 type:complete len:614 (-) Transcript_72304:320-2161(-)